MTTHLMRILPAAALAALLAAAPARAESKVGYVDMSRVINEVNEARVAKARLQQEYQAKQKQLDEKQVAFERFSAEAEKQGAVLSDAAKREKAAEIQKRAAELQDTFGQLQDDLSRREAELMSAIVKRVQALLAEIGKAEGFSMFIDRRVILWADPSLEVTNELIRKYNDRHKATAPPAPKPGKPAAKADAKPKRPAQGKAASK